MGQMHSEGHQDFIRKKNPSEWQLLSLQNDHELWMNRNTRKKYMAYPINIQESTSQHNLQMYHFRKLNQLTLIAPDMIIKSKEDLCTQASGVYLLIENIPTRLREVNAHLNFHQRLSILTVTFSALHTLNYVYGPLFISQTSIGFNEEGHIKVWINDDYSSNQPSNNARNDLDPHLRTATDDLMLDCVTEVLRIVGNREVSTYPLDFRQEVNNVETFAEGEQFIYSYCQGHGIQLKDSIDVRRSEFSERNFEFKENTTYIIGERQPSRQEHHFSYPESSQSSFISHQTYRPVNDQSYHSTIPNRALVTYNSNFRPRSSGASNKVIISYGKQEPKIQQNRSHVISIKVPIPAKSINKEPYRFPPPAPIIFKRQNNTEVDVSPHKMLEKEVQKDLANNQLHQQKIGLNFIEHSHKIQNFSPQRKNQDPESKADSFTVTTSPLQLNKQEQNQIQQGQSTRCLKHGHSPSLEQNIILTNNNSSLDHTINIEDDIKTWQTKILLNLSRKQQSVEEVDRVAPPTPPQPVKEIIQNQEVYQHEQEEESEAQQYPYSPYPDDIEKYIREKYSRYLHDASNTQYEPKSYVKKETYQPFSSSNQYKSGYDYGYQEDYRYEDPTLHLQPSIKNIFLNFKKDSSRYRFPSCYTIKEEAKQSQLTSNKTIKYTTFRKIDIQPSHSSQQASKSLERSLVERQKQKRKQREGESRLEERYNKYVANRGSSFINKGKNTTVSYQGNYSQARGTLQREQKKEERSYGVTGKKQGSNVSRQWHKKMMMK